MSSTTTPVRPGRTARPCRSAGWTTRRTTGSSPGNKADYIDTSGCGNSLNVGNPACLRLILDSLRYWVTEMGVDGFRFDLAPSLARQEGGFDTVAAFFDLVWQDPVIAQVKLIAEPWDVGQGDSYDVGRFPAGWSEWNGKFRDTVRDFWRSHDGLLPDLATRLTGSPDLYTPHRRGPDASVNLVTVHDGFTLRDLVSYNDKHNEANTEHNRDGTSDNRSWNCGAEGPTDRSGRSPHSRPGNAGRCCPPCCWPGECRCCWAATNSAGPSRATTTPTARTARSPGGTGLRSIPSCATSPRT